MNETDLKTAYGSEAVTAVVKWYDPKKGYGFVKPNDGSGDAFLHASVLQAAGHRDILDAAVIECTIAPGDRGPQVDAIVSVKPPEDDGEPAETVEATVKFFNAAKGFGFAVPDDGGRDIFISARVLARSDLETLTSAQRVRLSIRSGQKGPIAELVEEV